MVDRINDIYVMYELVKEGTIAQTAAYIRATEKYFGWNVVKRLIDPNFGRKPLLSSGMSVIDEFYKYRISFKEADDNKDNGQLKVKEYLHYDRMRPLDINNKPKLFFVKERCPITIRSVQNLQYDEWKGITAENKEPREDTKEKDSHGSDTMRYLCISSPRFYIPSSYEPSIQGAYY